MKKVRFILILLMMATVLFPQSVTKIEHSIKDGIDKTTFILSKPIPSSKKIKISGNVAELPVNLENAGKLLPKNWVASTIAEGNWLKLIYPDDFSIISAITGKRKKITISAVNINQLKSEIREDIANKKYKEGITKVRAGIKFLPKDGEFWYLGGILRQKMNEPRNAQINFAKAKKFGYKPDASPKIAKQENNTPKKETKTVEPTPDEQPVESGNDEEAPEAMTPWPFILILAGLILLLILLYGQRKHKLIDDEELLADIENEAKVKKKKSIDSPKAGRSGGVSPKPQKPVSTQKPDFSKLDEQPEVDLDATIYYSGDIEKLTPDELMPEIDFNIDYPVLKNKEKETFESDEEIAIDSVVRDISHHPDHMGQNDADTEKTAEEVALNVARRRLMEMGNEKCKSILIALENGVSHEEIAIREGVSVGDVSLVERYLKIK